MYVFCSCCFIYMQEQKHYILLIWSPKLELTACSLKTIHNNQTYMYVTHCMCNYVS